MEVEVLVDYDIPAEDLVKIKEILEESECPNESLKNTFGPNIEVNAPYYDTVTIGEGIYSFTIECDGIKALD